MNHLYYLMDIKGTLILLLIFPIKVVEVVHEKCVFDQVM